MATFILKNTTDTVSAAGQLEFNTDKKTLVVGDGTNQVVIAKMNVENEGSFLLTGDVKLSGSIYLGDVAADSIAAIGTFTTNLIPNTNNSIDIGNTTRYWRNIYATSITGAIAATNGVISGSSQIAGILPAGVVSGSSQITYSQISGISLNIVSSSTDTANVDITITNGNISAELKGNVVSSSAQIIDVIGSLNQYTSSNDTRWTTLAGVTSSLISFTGSQEFTNSIYNSYTQSTNVRLNNLELKSGSVDISISNINLFTGSQLTQNSTIGTYTASVESRFSTLATLTGSIATEQTNQNNRLTKLEESSASLNLYTQSLKDAIDVTGGNTTIKGNLIVAGTTTAVQSTTLNVADKNIVIASGSLNSAASDGAGITIDGAGVSMSWSHSNQRIELNKPLGILGAISASTITGLNGASVLTYSTSVDSRFISLVNRANLLEITSGAVNSFTQSVESRFSTLSTYTASIDSRLTEIGVVTGSLISSASAGAVSVTNLNLTSASLNTSISNLNLFTGSQLTQNNNLGIYTASVENRFIQIGVVSGSLISSASSFDGRFGTLANYTGSVENRLTEIGIVSGSLIASASTAKNTNDAQDISITNLNLFSASVTSSLVSLYQTTASLNLFSASVTSSLVSIYQTTSSLNTHTASALVSMSVIFTSASALGGRLNYLEGIAFGGLDISGQFAEIGNVTSSLITSASLVSQSVWHLHQFSASVTSSLVSLYQTTASLNLFTQSASQRLNSIELQSGSWVTTAITASSVATASITGTSLTFTKGDNSQFTLSIPTGSAVSASYAQTASLAERATQVDILVKNVSGTQINKGKVVRISGATGDNPLIVTASFLTEGQSANTLGITTQNIPNDSFGYVVTEGILLGVDTTGMTAGQLIYLGANGTFTTTPPTAPNHGVRLGEVLRDQQNNGSIYVRVDNGSELGEAHDVVDSTTNSSYGDVLMKSGSVWINNSTFSSSISSFSSSTNISVTNINSFTSSQLTQNSALATYTGSNDTKWSTLGSLSGSFARTNSTNTFNGNQIVSGSLIVTQDFIVLGSSSITNVSSSTLNIGTNLITVAVNQPSVRFGGLSVIDSGSANASGSFLYDSVQDEFIFVHRGDGVNITSSHFVLGPETYNNLGNETYLTNNRLPKGTGKEHLVDSNITDNGTTITLGSNTVVTGTLVASGTSLVSASAQINGTQITNNTITIAGTSTALGGTITLATITGGSGIVSGSGQLGNYETTGRGIVSGSSQIVPLLPAGTVSGSSQVIGILSSLNSYTASNDTTNTNQNTSITNLNNATSSYETRGRGIVSGSSQITYGGISGIPSGIISGSSQIVPLLPAGTLSGSAQLTTEFDSRYLNTGGDSVFSSSVQIGNYVATITGTSNQVVVAGSGNNAAAITLSTPQNIHTAATPQFASLGIGTAASGVTGEIRATADIVAFYSSDERLKENIQPIQNALTKVEAISGNTYDWKEGFETIHSHKGNDIGVIAQEVEKILPQAVIDRDNGYKAVDYEKIVPLLIEAIKELSAKVKELENK